jgi:hypothetical protein
VTAVALSRHSGFVLLNARLQQLRQEFRINEGFDTASGPRFLLMSLRVRRGQGRLRYPESNATVVARAMTVRTPPLSRFRRGVNFNVRIAMISLSSCRR